MDMPPVKMAALGSVRLLHVDVLCRSSDQGSWLYGEGGVKQGQVRVERSLFPNRCSFLKSFFSCQSCVHTGRVHSRHLSSCLCMYQLHRDSGSCISLRHEVRETGGPSCVRRQHVSEVFVGRSCAISTPLSARCLRDRIVRFDLHAEGPELQRLTVQGQAAVSALHRVHCICHPCVLVLSR